MLIGACWSEETVRCLITPRRLVQVWRCKTKQTSALSLYSTWSSSPGCGWCHSFSYQPWLVPCSLQKAMLVRCSARVRIQGNHVQGFLWYLVRGQCQDLGAKKWRQVQGWALTRQPRGLKLLIEVCASWPVLHHDYTTRHSKRVEIFNDLAIHAISELCVLCTLDATTYENSCSKFRAPMFLDR